LKGITFQDCRFEAGCVSVDTTKISHCIFRQSIFKQLKFAHVSGMVYSSPLGTGNVVRNCSFIDVSGDFAFANSELIELTFQRTKKVDLIIRECKVVGLKLLAGKFGSLSFMRCESIEGISIKQANIKSFLFEHCEVKDFEVVGGVTEDAHFHHCEVFEAFLTSWTAMIRAEQTQLPGAHIENCNFDVFHQSWMGHDDINFTRFINCDLSHSQIINTAFGEVFFYECDFTKTEFQECNRKWKSVKGIQAKFKLCKLTGARFFDCEFYPSTLSAEYNVVLKDVRRYYDVSDKSHGVHRDGNHPAQRLKSDLAYSFGSSFRPGGLEYDDQMRREKNLEKRTVRTKGKYIFWSCLLKEVEVKNCEFYTPLFTGNNNLTKITLADSNYNNNGIVIGGGRLTLDFSTISNVNVNFVTGLMKLVAISSPRTIRKTQFRNLSIKYTAGYLGIVSLINCTFIKVDFQESDMRELHFASKCRFSGCVFSNTYNLDSQEGTVGIPASTIKKWKFTHAAAA